MKLRHALLILAIPILFITTVKPLFADPDRFTSEEWFSMPADNRFEYVSMAKDDLESYGVPLSKSLDEYVSGVNDLFKKHPQMSARSVSTMLPSFVYSSEPKAKQVIDELVEKKKIDKIEKL